MVRRLLFSLLSHLTICLVLVGLMPAVRAGAQTAAPEVVALDRQGHDRDKPSPDGQRFQGFSVY